MVYNRFARWCSEREIQVDIFTPGKRGITNMGSVRVINVPMRIPLPYYQNLHFDLIPNYKLIRKHFESHSFDLIHLATQGHMGLMGEWISRKHDVPTVACYHTAVPEYVYDRFLGVFGNNFLGRFLGRGGKAITWWWQDLLFNQSKLMFVPTKSIEEMVQQHLDMPTSIWSRGVDSAAFSPEKRNRREEGSVRTLYAGRISIEKNLSLLKDLRLPDGQGMVFIGNGPYLDNLKKAMPAAEFTGFLIDEPLQQAYADGDIFVFPSKTDTFGNAVLEAMSSGLPVVVTNVLGPKDFVEHGVTGFVATNDEEFIEYHALLMEERDLRKKMGAAAREYALSQSWDHVFQHQVIDKYAAVLAAD